MKNTTYDKLKWVALIALPAVATFVGTVGQAVNYPSTGLLVLTITALATLLGTLLGVSNVNYKKGGEE